MQLVDHVVERLNAAHLGGGAYVDALAAIGDVTSATVIAFQAETTAPRALSGAATAVAPPGLVEAYPAVIALNPMTDLRRLPGGWFPLGRTFRSEEYIARAEVRRSDFYSEFGRYWGGLTGSAGFLVRSGPGGYVLLTMTFDDDVPDDDRDDAIRALDSVRAPVIASFDLASALYQRGLAAGVAATLATLPTAAAVLDETGRVVAFNERWMPALRGAGLSISRGGRMSGRGPGGAALDTALARVACTTTSLEVVRLAGADVSRVLALVPMRARSAARLLAEEALPGPAVLALLFDPRDRPGSVAPVLSAVYGLTSAEADVAVRLAAGETLRQIADTRGVVYETIRNQLGAVTAKLGVSRQSEVAALVTRLASHLPAMR